MGAEQRNWAGNLAYGAERVATPGSVDELADEVRAAADAGTGIRALGTRHCFNRIADTDGLLVSTAGLPAEVAIDAERRVVRTSGGIRYGDLGSQLQHTGWALPNLASLPHISVAGAIATGTHGSGDRVGTLSSAVAGLELVTAAGERVLLRRGDPDFAGAVVGIGALGVVTHVELDIVPTFDIAQTVYQRVPLDAVLADLDAVTGAGYSVSMFFTWRDPDAVDQVWLKRRADASGQAPDELLGARQATVKVDPLGNPDAEHCTDQLGVPGAWLDRLPHFRLGFTPSRGEELQAEFLVPRRNAVAAIEVVRTHAAAIAPLLFASEVRTMAADDLWLSPAAGTDAVGIHFTFRQEQPAVDALVHELGEALAPFDARPHWGKLFDVDSAAPRMAELYPHWGDFAALRERYDPSGAFRNDFLARLGL
ncbi:FAD-binding protein [Agromyces mangrovi Wang et al. 2018]|uniref:FAD-binding protein n=1 Tax=Agromyces mangrovi TaxID=1858653 RepID=UPI0025742C50|nr:FAD-binding protein [Agromyces mangrovi]BDZ65621.1 xylitol oxidase [Agromyces mangrovi]